MIAFNIDDASCVSINQKYRLIAIGRKNSHVSVFTIDEVTGYLELIYTNVLSSKDFPGNFPGKVNHLNWTPDGCAIIVSWQKIGSFSLWSSFGSLLACSLAWDYGLTTNKPFFINSMDWSCEGYHLLMILKTEENFETQLLQLDFIKSALTVNPCVCLNPYLLLQGDDKILVNNSDTLDTLYESIQTKELDVDNIHNEHEIKAILSSKFLSASKLWNNILVPTAYMNANWPIRFSALDQNGHHLAVAGKSGLALYSLLNKKWKLFGNELQEKDFVVTGGILWWNKFIIVCNYNLSSQKDEIRTYPRDQKLDNKYSESIEVGAPIILSNVYGNQLIIFTADSSIMIFNLTSNPNFELLKIKLSYIYDVKSICLHPAFVVSLSLTNFKNESCLRPFIETEPSETIFLNVSGRVLMIQRERKSDILQFNTTCLASCVECIWFYTRLPKFSKNIHLQESLWFYCGGGGFRVWLRVFPRYDEDTYSHKHSYMAKRIMLSFNLRIYPLAISFEDAIIFGVENDTTLFCNDQSSHFSFPFSILKRTSQLYLHQILKQLIKRNLGYNAWEIARDCSTLPYFPHSLELLLHEVLEHEATSKDPIPDALLPRVIEFIKEFPCYLQTIVQCARKTEIALWPYLFNAAGKPIELFQDCIEKKLMYSATNYLIILQNFESSTVSQQCTLMLLNISLEQKKWSLSYELIRFLKAIEPSDSETVDANSSKTQYLQPTLGSAVDINLVLPIFNNKSSIPTFGTISQKGDTEKRDAQQVSNTEIACRRKTLTSDGELDLLKKLRDSEHIDSIVFKHVKKFMQRLELLSLGYLSAALNFELVSWIAREKKRDEIPKIENFVEAINILHQNLQFPKPSMSVNNFQSNDLDEKNDITAKTISKTQNESLDSGLGSNNSNSKSYSTKLKNQNITKDFKKRSSCNSSESRVKTQLCYLLQIFYEANCLDYALLISTILLDNTSITRICNSAARPPFSISLIRQLKCGLEDLTKWSINECYGYRNLMLNCCDNIKMLENILLSHNIVTFPEYSQSSKLNYEISSDISNQILLKNDRKQSFLEKSNLNNLNFPNDEILISEVKRKNSKDTLAKTNLDSSKMSSSCLIM